jgi:hypothetical protein
MTTPPAISTPTSTAIRVMIWASASSTGQRHRVPSLYAGRAGLSISPEEGIYAQEARFGFDRLLAFSGFHGLCNVLMPSSVVPDFPKYLGTSVRGRKLNHYSWL